MILENQLIENFFDKKLNVSYDIDYNFEGKKNNINVEMQFKVPVDSFLFDKLIKYCGLDLENKKNYYKAKEFFLEVIEFIKVEGMSTEGIMSLGEFQFYVDIIITKIKQDLLDLKKK